MDPSIIFFIGLFLLALWFFYRARTIERIERQGVSVIATVTHVERFPGVTYVTAQWWDPQTHQVYTFRNGTVFSTLPAQRGSRIMVLVDPHNHKRYYMPLGLQLR